MHKIKEHARKCSIYAKGIQYSYSKKQHKRGKDKQNNPESHNYYGISFHEIHLRVHVSTAAEQFPTRILLGMGLKSYKVL
ncbi:hypothetical protein JCM16138_18030 [Thermococcus atlanticus]